MIPKRQTLVLSKLYSNSLFYYALCFQDISDPVNNVKVCTDNSAEHWIKKIAIFTDVQISDYGILGIKGPKKNLNKRRLKAMFHYSLYT